MKEEYVDKMNKSIEYFMDMKWFGEQELELFKTIALVKVGNELEKINSCNCHDCPDGQDDVECFDDRFYLDSLIDEVESGEICEEDFYNIVRRWIRE